METDGGTPQDVLPNTVRDASGASTEDVLQLEMYRV
jgi:hypothetical protein